jgi:hypothetical protein
LGYLFMFSILQNGRTISCFQGYFFIFFFIVIFNSLLWWYFLGMYHFSLEDNLILQNKVLSYKEKDFHDVKVEKFNQMIKNYFDYHNKVMRNKEPNAKFSTCVSNAGWGNRFQHVLSCVLYSMISNRVVVLTKDNSYFFEHFDKIFDEPIQLVNYDKTFVPSPDDTWWADPKESACVNLTTFKENVKCLSVIPPGYYDYWGSSILYNPNHNLLHEIPSNWYHLLFKSLFHLKNSLQKDLDIFKEKYFGKYTIGIQVRTWSRNVAGPDALRNPNIPIDVFLQAAELLATSAPVPFEDVSFLVVTPDSQNLQRALFLYGKKKIVFLEGEINEHTELGTRNGLINFYLMGECDDLIVSEISSYGTNAGARNGKAPVICNHERICYRKLTPDPCQDSPYPIQSSPCIGENLPNKYMPGIQSTCAYFGYQRQHRRWFDLYNSWNWTFTDGRKPTWPLGDVNGVLY